MATILLTGAGGAAIPSLIRHLKGLGHRVLACDMNPQAPGLFLADQGFVVPPATEPHYLDALYSVMRAHKVDLTVPLIDEELPHCADLSPFIMPSMGFVKICLDKWELMQRLSECEITVPRTVGNWGDAESLPFPRIIKPRTGRGSRDVARVDTQDQFLWRMKHDFHPFRPPWMFQEYIDGPEYTVSVVCDQHNTVHAVVPKEIIRKEGSTWLAVTRRNDRIDALCRRIAETMQPHGPFNVQLRLRDGEPYVFEINPRFSGTVNLTIAAGCDEVGGLIELALGNPYTFREWKEGVVLVRHMEDSIMEETEFNGKAPVRWDG